MCLALDSAIGLLNEMELDVSSAEYARQECVTELFTLSRESLHSPVGEKSGLECMTT